METLPERYDKYLERYKRYQDLADAMRIDGHEGMAKVWQRTADNALSVTRVIEGIISMNTKYDPYRGGRVEIHKITTKSFVS